MDTKTAADIHFFDHILQRDIFDQDSVKSFFISIRDPSNYSQWIREIGDFIAHPNRDKGKSVEHHSLFNIENRNNKLSICIPSPKNLNDIVDDLSLVFDSADLKPDNLVSKRKEIIFCIMCILEGSIIAFKDGRSAMLRLSSKNSSDKTGNPYLDLVMVYNDNQEELLFMISKVFCSDFFEDEVIDPIDYTILYRAVREDNKLVGVPMIFQALRDYESGVDNG